MQVLDNSEGREIAVVPTSLFIPKSLHSRVKTVAGLKRVRMADIFIEGVRMALEADQFQVSDDERTQLFPA